MSSLFVVSLITEGRDAGQCSQTTTVIISSDIKRLDGPAKFLLLTGAGARGRGTVAEMSSYDVDTTVGNAV